MYPAYIAVANMQEEKNAVISLNGALEAEKTHASMYGDARKAAVEKKDIALSKVQICDVCGYAVEGDAPDKCPVCGVSKDLFTAF